MPREGISDRESAGRVTAACVETVLAVLAVRMQRETAALARK